MRQIPVTEAKAHLAKFLRMVESGKTLAITRRGKTIAHVIPPPSGGPAHRQRAVARFRRRLEEWQTVSMSVGDILLARHQSHRL